MRHYITVLAFMTSFCGIIYAQQSAAFTNDLMLYNQATELYNNKQFLAAQLLFDKVKDAVDDENIEAECAYYIANCAIWLNQKGADDLMENFVTEYPTSVKRNAAYLDVANYYFDNGKYAYARKWYDRVEVYALSAKEKEKFNFNNGYAYFKIQRFNEAKKFFEDVQESRTYGAKAKYYLGFIAYEGDDYQEANQLFDEVKDLNEYNKNLSYFQSDMNFKSGNFEEAIKEGLVQLPKSKPTEKSELNKIIGESYFNLKQYGKAIQYLKAYRGRKGKWTNTDYYQLGYAYYKEGNYEEAISEFNKIIEGRNATAQNAYYHLAESYLKTDQKQQALNAFKNASEMDFDATIKEDAFYNYAKLSYEIGNSYQSTPKILLGFMDQYPGSEKKEEMKELLINSYLTSKNYKEAMELLESTRNFADKVVYQKVAYYRAIELYTSGNYDEGLIYFTKSLSQPRDPSYTSKATYWKAETLYMLGQYEEALVHFKQFKDFDNAQTTVVFENIDYSLGYTYFKLKQYLKSIEHFSKFINTAKSDDVRLADAYLRLGDSNFISSKYWPAMEAYNKAIQLDGPNADYAHYQKAISYGFVGKNDKKISDLELFLTTYTRSVYRDDAMYGLGNTYIAKGDVSRGIATYDRLIDETPRSSYVPKALLKQGLVYYNNDQGDQALSKFKKVVSQYPGSEDAVQAVKTARLVYVDLGRTDEYASWVKGLSFVNVTDEDLDNTSYEAVEKQLVDGNENKAIDELTKYLKDFPNGINALKSHFTLAQLYAKQNNNEAALPHYQYVIAKEQTEYTEQALLKVSRFYLEQEQYDKALPLLSRLEQIADYPQNIIFAQSNIMKAHYQLVHYPETITYAEKVLANPKIQQEVKDDAQLFLARAALQTADESRARQAYQKVQQTARGELAAESLYYDAYFKNKDANYKASNESIQRLSKEYSGYKLYGAKGLVLMAKNFYGLKDAYQATYILESVIKNFTAYPDVVAEASEELQRIKKEEAKTNASIQTEQ
ncbi:tetratricopeptide repeat protein [Aquimarina intermedia]|uniref:Tetratricopeptide repeat protein n=1 Tax=Aquimarina intermedia TaxID=350814 RepID=A0A5S5BXW4_9FLAO|nr:tetratricopeptide repeat protein [Aquimarina intermedia]TYP70980.1 tetratricopeptide repeat protein [Aquimarina intermedia]